MLWGEELGIFELYLTDKVQSSFRTFSSGTTEYEKRVRTDTAGSGPEGPDWDACFRGIAWGASRWERDELSLAV